MLAAKYCVQFMVAAAFAGMPEARAGLRYGVVPPVPAVRSHRYDVIAAWKIPISALPALLPAIAR